MQRNLLRHATTFPAARPGSVTRATASSRLELVSCSLQEADEIVADLPKPRSHRHGLERIAAVRQRPEL